MATSKTGGSTQNNRESQSKRLGCKKFGGEFVVPGNIIIRQRGTKFHPGTNVLRGTDDTLFAITQGFVKFKSGLKGRTYVSVLPDKG